MVFKLIKQFLEYWEYLNEFNFVDDTMEIHTQKSIKVVLNLSKFFYKVYKYKWVEVDGFKYYLKQQK